MVTSTNRNVEGRAGVSRVEEAYRRILALITEGALTQGDRLPSEPEMAASFGISRPVIRQALTRLQQAGVVDVRWGAGSYVRNVGQTGGSDPTFGPIRSLEEVRFTYELRAAIEGEAAALAAERGPSPALDAARKALAKLDDVLATDVVGQDADLEFHFAIAAASQNPFFERMLRSIRPSLEFSINLARTLSLTFPHERLRIVQAEHIAILRSIEAGDPVAAREAMRAHVLNALRRIFQGPGAPD
jgi:GntR family transcriptional repressor for pyruvate dehydrogenase complex